MTRQEMIERVREIAYVLVHRNGVLQQDNHFRQELLEYLEGKETGNKQEAPQVEKDILDEIESYFEEKKRENSLPKADRF